MAIATMVGTATAQSAEQTGRQRSVQEAEAIATQWLQAHGMQEEAQLHDISAETPLQHLFVLAQEGGGFVLVARGKEGMAVWGYSLSSNFGTGTMPEHVAEQLLALDRMAGTGVYGQLVATDKSPSAKGGNVGPLLTTTWNQAPYYNDLCPEHANAYYYGGRCPSGCVATAMAQVMKYWEHPTTGYGRHAYMCQVASDSLVAEFGETTYDWDNMPNALTGSSSDAQVEAVATLMYHCGVAVEMDYNYYASGAQVSTTSIYFDPSAMTALVEHFKYAPTIKSVSRNDFGSAAWDSVLRTELDASRPILFSGESATAGHAFVCDGYDDDNFFHINWGWGGVYDGYFPMGGLDPEASGIGGNSESSYNINNTVLIGIEPCDDWGEGGVLSATVSGGAGSVTGTGTYEYGAKVQLFATAPAGYRFDGWTDGEYHNPRTIYMTGGDLSFEAKMVPIAQSDTIGYCATSNCLSSFTSGGASTCWGIRIPASSIEAGRKMVAVQAYFNSTTDATYYIKTGYYSPTTTLQSGTMAAPASGMDWGTVVFETPIELSGDKDVWIMMESEGKYPATVSYGCGNHDGFLLNETMGWGGWNDYTFMLRAVLEPKDGYVPHTVNVTAMGAGCSTSGGGQYNHGEEATLTATAAERMCFVRWADAATGSTLSTSNPYTFTVTEDMTINAIFEQCVFTLTVSSDNEAMGSVDGGGDYDKGEEATLTANAHAGYVFDHWTGGLTDNPLVVVATEDANYVAYFKEKSTQGIDEAGEWSPLLYPNPTSGWLCIGTTGMEGETLRVMDMLGRTVMEATVAGDETRVDLSHMQPGVYHLRVADRTAKVQVL